MINAVPLALYRITSVTQVDIYFEPAPVAFAALRHIPAARRSPQRHRRCQVSGKEARRAARETINPTA